MEGGLDSREKEETGAGGRGGIVGVNRGANVGVRGSDRGSDRGGGRNSRDRNGRDEPTAADRRNGMTRYEEDMEEDGGKMKLSRAARAVIQTKSDLMRRLGGLTDDTATATTGTTTTAGAAVTDPGGSGLAFLVGRRIPFLAGFTFRPSVGIISTGSMGFVINALSVSMFF